ncbi:uncharacterized protein SPPG_03688 [Spizellomyces punctatus DAOM BR117]|uniref:Steroid 5-alpha reductase C-terminal domain-containing protein n=1 Tax=Spizellomyces punctatus (strain DAOM BR117) TaxID=645134 RepID=A0A0L0HLG3_SPIPD|nr:uncharacterized protein SPPG_03688 [Spizellomyces punctatus DAOM BR117]KND01898.1 hypothetical protein SPPG_03688 [Spizellomyces punctatus DAOM BR117]|eukprot:XP_016609937.1 hypothetical protein SPPG_03688 [Spizellomyces punctatus DAOM BR117]
MPSPQPYTLPADFASSPKSSPADLTPQVSRSVHLTPAKTLFVALRTADPILQYLIFAKGWGNALFRVLGLTAATPVIGILSPRQKLLVGFAAVGAVRQIYWCLHISENALTPAESLHVSLFNLLTDTLNTLVSLSVPAWHLTLRQYTGTLLFCIGSVVETLSELQRKWFKERKENKNKVVTEGLWKGARHINYGGYVLWRGGYALSTGNLYALWNPIMHIWDFTARGIPVLDHYMSHKYKEQWGEYKRQTPYKLFPYIW